MKRILIITIIFSGWFSSLRASDSLSIDTSEVYIEDLTHLLSLKLFTLSKSNTLEVIYPDGRVILRPNGITNLGLGFKVK